MSKLSVSVHVEATWVMFWLKELEAAIPPPIGQHHSLTYAQFGSDAGGWEDRLCLQIRLHNGSQNFFIDDDDFVLTNFEATVAEMKAAIEGRL